MNHIIGLKNKMIKQKQKQVLVQRKSENIVENVKHNFKGHIGEENSIHIINLFRQVFKEEYDLSDYRHYYLKTVL